MTFLDDHTDDRYADEAEARLEFGRVAGACHECRRCTDRCGAFPLLFDLLDRLDRHDAGLMTPEEQDRVADACFHCGECLVGCADGPIDVPRAMLRLEAVRHAARRRPARDRAATWVLARPRLDRALLATSAARSTRRRIVSASLGRSAESPALERRSRRPSGTPGARGGGTGVVVVTDRADDAFDGRAVADAVALFSALGVACEVVTLDAGAAVALQAGEIDRFGRIAERNIERLASPGATAPIVVLDPSHHAMLTGEYARALGPTLRAGAESVAARVIDLASRAAALFDDGPAAHVPDTIVLHADARMVESGETEATRRLLSRWGVTASLIEGSSGLGTACAQRTLKDDAVADVAARFVARIETMAGEGDIVVSSCRRTGAMLRGRVAAEAVHPATLLARAAGVAEGVAAG